MNIFAIIPARGGSKGIVKKNLQYVGDKRLIERTINAAKDSKKINKIIVSTDDSHISKISKKNNVEVFQRSSDLSNDFISSEAVLLDVIKKINKKYNLLPDLIVFLQCTAPFIHAHDIDGTINALIENNADSALAVKEFHHFLWKHKEDGVTAIGINHNQKIPRVRRQDIVPQYLEAGSVYVMKTKGFVERENRFFGKVVTYKTPEERVFEIDTPADLMIANKLASMNNID